MVYRSWDLDLRRIVDFGLQVRTAPPAETPEGGESTPDRPLPVGPHDSEGGTVVTTLILVVTFALLLTLLLAPSWIKPGPGRRRGRPGRSERPERPERLPDDLPPDDLPPDRWRSR